MAKMASNAIVSPSTSLTAHFLAYLPWLLLFGTLYTIYRLSLVAIRTYRVRKSYLSVPCLPRSALTGNLLNIGPYLATAASTNRHPDYAFEEVWKILNYPPAFLMDLAPISRSFLVITDPSIAETLVQPSTAYKWSIPKSDTLGAMSRLIGNQSIIMAEGEQWRELRRRFNKGFSLAHLNSLVPMVMEKMETFVTRLKNAAESAQKSQMIKQGEEPGVFKMQDFAQDLTTDIITELTLNVDFKSQTMPEGQGHKGPTGLLTASRILSSLVFVSGQGINWRDWIDPVRPVKSWYYERIFNNQLYKFIKHELEKEKSGSTAEDEKLSTDTGGASAKAIIRLATSGMQPTDALIRNTVDQIKSFLFAGQDTTATLLQWICFELAKSNYSPSHAAILKKLQKEHDHVFGSSDPFSALQMLSEPGQAEMILGDKLPYTTAFVKEALRLHPPAGTARMIPDISKDYPHPINVDINGQSVQINGLRIYPCQHLLHRNKAVWGEDVLEFKPDRWLDEEYMSKLPTGAWRAFERGPRNCIGQELAMAEGKIMLACVARGFEFEKAGLDGLEGREEVFGTYRVTSVPIDGMRMKVKLR